MFRAGRVPVIAAIVVIVATSAAARKGPPHMQQATARAHASSQTALDRYVAAPDSSFKLETTSVRVACNAGVIPERTPASNVTATVNAMTR